MRNKDCKPNTLISNIRRLLETAEKSNDFFPKSLKISSKNVKDILLGKSNGGWGDVRDHNLCLKFTEPQAEENYEYIKFLPT